MKFSYNWLTEFVEGAALPPKELGRLITMQTAECEGIETLGDDSIIEIDNKSLTHRPDLWGHYGMAREVAAITGGRLTDPVRMELLLEGAPAIDVAIEDLALCPRYSALTFENVEIGPSPSWMQDRLTAIGLNPINNIVDVTNYVMAELAQPTHAFDWDLLRGDTIFVRVARAGERILALNEEEYHLDPRDLVIADARGPIAIAGVIGGLDTGIHDGTRRLVLESANFLASAVRKTSSRQKLRTDASIRLEKAQDPHNTVRGLARALELLEQVSPGIRVVGGVADAKKEFTPPPPITLPMDWLVRKLGRPIEMAEVVRILESLAFRVTESARCVLSVTVPSWRATRDISIKDDLVEEVGRMIGYGSIPIQPPALPVVPPHRNEERLFHRQLRASLIELGFTEVQNYSFVNEEEVRALGFDPSDNIKVTNPISSDQGLLRTNLLAGIRRNILENSKHFEQFRLFEIGREIHRELEGLPREIPHLAAVVSARDDGRAALMELKRVAEHLMPGCEIVPVECRSCEHPARVAEVHWRSRAAGRMFEMHPSLVEKGRAAVLDLDLTVLQELSAGLERRYAPIRRYPSSAFDLSVIAGVRELAGEIQKKLTAYAGADLVSIEFQREYIGPPLPENVKSISFRLTVAAPDRTLSSDEVASIRARTINSMRSEGYELRV